MVLMKNSLKERGRNTCPLKGRNPPTKQAAKILRKDELETLSEVVNVYPDLPVYLTAAYSWGIDRIDQPSLPLNNMYTPAFKGCGADIYVIDTGIDTNHFEFTPVVGSISFRTVSNIFNQFGDLSSNIDGHGHGTHCAGNTYCIPKCS